jgi:hypothetical protein
LGDGEVQFKKLGQQVFLGGETVGGEDGGVQGGMGVFKRVRAGQFERAVKGAQADAPRCPSLGKLFQDLKNVGNEAKLAACL